MSASSAHEHDAPPAGQSPAGGIIPGAEPCQRNFVGLLVEFDLRRRTKTTRERGRVQSQRWLGFTERGRIPEYELIVIGLSGTPVRTLVTEHHVVPVEG